MPELIAQWNPARGAWETGTASLICGHWEPFSGIWPTSGMTRSGMASELPTWERRMGDSGSSFLPGLLPTPRATCGGSAAETMKLLPTPTATYSGNTAANHLKKKPGRTTVTDLRILVEEVGLE